MTKKHFIEMTKKHFIEMAGLIRHHAQAEGASIGDQQMVLAGMKIMALHMGHKFGKRFDSYRFRAACEAM